MGTLKRCAMCQEPFDRGSSRYVYCSDECARASWKKMWNSKNRGYNKNPGFLKINRGKKFLAQPTDPFPQDIVLESGEYPGTGHRSDNLLEYLELYAHRAQHHVPLNRSRNNGRTHGGTVMGRPSVGEDVRLVVPENVRLHGAEGVVESLREWGAFVKTVAAAGGEFRALWCEMERLSPPVTQTPITAYDAVQSPYLNGHAKDYGYTGSTCPNCQGSRVRRTGPCETCEDCGTNNGCS